MEIDEEIKQHLIKEEIIEKFCVLASAFNITFTECEYVISDSNRRIYFKDVINGHYGYININTKKINEKLMYDKDNYSIYLYTDIGEVIGTYTPYNKLFTYKININKFNKIIGHLKFNTKESPIYDGISSSLEILENDKSICNVNFNYYDINGIFLINNNYSNEKLVYDIWNGIKINYDNNVNRLEINIQKKGETFETNTYENKAYCKFNNEVFSLDINESNDLILGSNIWQNAGEVDIKPILLSNNCKEMLEFINKTRNIFTFHALNGDVIFLYDNIANLCFGGSYQKSYLEFSQAKKGKSLNDISEYLKINDNLKITRRR